MTENRYGTAKKVGMQSLTLREEEDVGEEEEEQSERLDPMELSWKSALVWDFLKLSRCFLSNVTQELQKHAPNHIWPLLLYFHGRSFSRWRRRSGSVRARMSGGRVFAILPGDMSQQQRSKGHLTMRHAVHKNTPEWLLSACTMHSRNPVRPRGTHWCMLSH